MGKKKHIPDATRRAVAIRYGCEPGESKAVTCHWCGTPGEIFWHRLRTGAPSSWVSFSLDLDHLIPEVDGGTGDPDNIVLACARCNRGRRHWVTGSRAPHVQCSEEGSPNSPQMHPRKGREGKGSGRGRWLRFIHDLRLLGRPDDKRMGDFVASSRGVR